MRNLELEIGTVLAKLREAWNSLDFDAVANLWDRNEARPFYLAEEAQEPLTDWDSLRGYWDTTRRITRALSMRIWGLDAKLIADDLAVALWRMHWNADVDGFERPIGGENRVSAIFRRDHDSWHFIHYVEAPLAPILYVRQHYERDVDPDFAAARDAEEKPK